MKSGEEERGELGELGELLKVFYDFSLFLHEGLALARDHHGWFHMDRDGKPAYEERFEGIATFSGGRAQVKKHGEWFYILPDGTKVD